MNWADRQGLIQTDGTNKTKVKKIDGRSVRCVWLKLNEFEDRDGFSPVKIGDEEENVPFEQEELPFK